MFAGVLSLTTIAVAGCKPGSGQPFDLFECFTLNDQGDTVRDVYQTPADLVNLLVTNLFVIAGVLLFLLIIFSGIKFISGGTKGKDEAKTIMTTAVAGFAIMFLAFWLIRILEWILGVSIIF